MGRRGRALAEREFARHNLALTFNEFAVNVWSTRNSSALSRFASVI
jgi:hypothetical protein